MMTGEFDLPVSCACDCSERALEVLFCQLTHRVQLKPDRADRLARLREQAGRRDAREACRTGNKKLAPLQCLN